jgi:hypothetical protein
MGYAHSSLLPLLCSWLREQHTVAGGINSLFARSLESRLKMFIANPILAAGESETDVPVPQETPNQSFAEGISTQDTSTPSAAHLETPASRVQSADISVGEYQPVDMIVENPVFGSGLRLKRVS